jgi:hypothetical protein
VISTSKKSAQFLHEHLLYAYGRTRQRVHVLFIGIWNIEGWSGTHFFIATPFERLYKDNYVDIQSYQLDLVRRFKNARTSALSHKSSLQRVLIIIFVWLSMQRSTNGLADYYLVFSNINL